MFKEGNASDEAVVEALQEVILFYLKKTRLGDGFVKLLTILAAI